MTENFLEPQSDAPRKKIWRRWKWIGLAVFAVAIVFGHWLPTPLVVLGVLYGNVVIANLLYHGFRLLTNRIFWRVRNRMIGAFVFVGVIPLLLLFVMMLLSGYVLFGQLAGRYLETSLEQFGHEITAINLELAGRTSSADPAATFAEESAQDLADHASRFPHLAARLLRRNADGSFEVVAAFDPGKIEKPVSPYPAGAWLESAPSYEGMVREEGTLLLVSLQPMPRSRDLWLVVSAPVDRFLEDRLQRERSIYCTILGVGRTDVTISTTSAQVTIGDKESGTPTGQSTETVQETGLAERRQGDPRRMVSWGVTLEAREYVTGKSGYAAFALLQVPFSTVYDYSVGKSQFQAAVFLKIIYILAGLFLFAECVSLIVGATLSRRITRSVHDMHQGILALQQGDLLHRIPVRRKDQLGLLAHAFNQMSGAITRLLEEVSEKKRLEQELEIAREVQATLFPKQLPHPRGMTVFGGCEPARVVSGDYYDFIVEDEAHLEIVVADISGKGISAALLMANLQAAMRNQLVSMRHDDPGEIEKSLAGVMTHLNRQIYLNSPAEKYATLFLSRYDAAARRLWFCNAGHLPPILLHDQVAEFLEPTGTVVGLLPDAVYQAKSVQLSPGSLLVIFTDGVTEAVNEAGEEFGTDRLLEALKESSSLTPEAIYQLVIDRLRVWQGKLPQHDDITLIVAKVA